MLIPVYASLMSKLFAHNFLKKSINLVYYNEVLIIKKLKYDA